MLSNVGLKPHVLNCQCFVLFNKVIFLWVFSSSITKDSSRAIYGPREIDVAHDRLAIQTLLLTDELFRYILAHLLLAKLFPH